VQPIDNKRYNFSIDGKNTILSSNFSDSSKYYHLKSITCMAE